jgi:RHS repeat-associated protein
MRLSKIRLVLASKMATIGCAIAKLLAWSAAAALLSTAHAQGNVVPPNGSHSQEVVDLSVQTAAGEVVWKRVFNGTGWRFNRGWDGISASYKPMMTQNTGGGSPVSSTSSGEPEVCWIWVDEDWQPGDGVAGLPAAGTATDPVRVAAQSYLPGNNSYNQVGQPLSVSVGSAFASACGGIGGNVTGGSGGTIEELEGFRRGSALYVGSAGTYIFKNRYLLKRQAVQRLPAFAGEPVGGTISLANLESVAEGWRWSDRAGDWAEYDDSGRMSRYGDKNNNAVWIQRNAGGQIARIAAAANGAINADVVISLHYNAGGFMVRAKDYPQAGNALDLPQRVVNYSYDAYGRMTGVTDVRGKTWQYAYDPKARLTQSTDPLSHATKLVYDQDGITVKQMIAADGGVSDFVFSYDDTKKLFYSKSQGPATPAGRRVEDYTHDRAGDLVRYEVNGRAEIEVKRDPVARTETRINARGFATIYTKNEFEQIVQVQNADGTKRGTQYEARLLNPVEDTDEAGIKTKYEYDTAGNLVRRIVGGGLPDERVTEFVVDSAGRPTRVTRKGRTEPNGTNTPDAVWQITYDAAGQVSQTIDPEGKQRAYVYNRLGVLANYVDPKSKSWLYTCDPAGNTLSETDPLAKVSTYSYDDNGNPLTATDPRSKVYRYAHDVKDRQTKRIDPLGGEYVTTFNPQDQVSQVADASGKTMRMEYDTLVRMSTATDGKNQVFRLEYTEPDGSEKNSYRPSKVQYPTLQRLLRYNEREFLSLKSDVAGAEGRVESFTYDPAGRRKTETDANGKTKFYEYNSHHEVTQVKDPLGNTMRLVRDTRGNVIEVVDPNNRSTRMTYDRRDLMVSSTDPLGNTTRYAYDENGWLFEIAQANGQKVSYAFDAVGRVTQFREYDALAALKKTTALTFDASGNLLTWSDGTHSAVRGYDDADRLVNETVTYGAGVTFSLSHAYTYHANGQIKTYTGPDGVTVGFDFDATGQLQNVSIPGEGSIAVTDWQWFQPKKVLLPGGAEQQLEYDGYQSLTRLKVVSPAQATLFELQNKYGKLAEVTQATFDGNALVYTHDDSGRLTQVQASALSGRSEAFGLDGASNRTSHSLTGASAWEYDAASQLTQRPGAGGSGTVSYQYDASGNLTVKTDAAKAEPARTTRYSWDAFNRLAEVRDGAGALIATYTYDPFDRRIRKELGASTTLQDQGLAVGAVAHYLASPWGLLAEADGAGAVQVTYGWSPQVEDGVAPLFARVPNPASAGGFRYVYYHNDHLGTPQRITDKAGNLVWSADYDAYGKATVKTTANPALALTSNLRLPGQYFDVETGLHYNDRRYYDPDTGRYTSRDPIGFEGGINLYAYAAAAPGRFIDPTGEIIPCLLFNYARCMLGCVGTDAAMNMAFGCESFDLASSAKDCAVSCVFSMLPIPNPCGKFGKLFGTAVGVAGAAGASPNSFAAETHVHVRPKKAGDADATHGKTELKAIKDLKIGDEVLAFAEWKDKGHLRSDTGDRLDERLSYEKVTDIATSYREQRIVHITLDDGSTIEATDGHPFRTTEGWRDAILLKKGGQLLLKGTDEADSERIKAINDVREEAKTVPVFNIEVANAHTFFIGDQGVLVHNATPNNGVACNHGGVAHNAWIDRYIGRLKKWTNADNVRKNQRQVDAAGKEMGRNRPDIQFDRNGKHHNREIDTNAKNSQNHTTTLNRNDPGAVNRGSTLP